MIIIHNEENPYINIASTKPILSTPKKYRFNFRYDFGIIFSDKVLLILSEFPLYASTGELFVILNINIHFVFFTTILELYIC